jgi:hypothetical protein
MLVDTISDASGVFVHVYDFSAVTGSAFPTPQGFTLQLGYAHYPDGKDVQPHVHKIVERTVDTTGEFIFMLDGEMDVTFLDGDHAVRGQRRFGRHMALLQMRGGHHIVFLAGARYLELKQGPYLGRDADKYDVSPPFRSAEP